MEQRNSKRVKLDLDAMLVSRSLNYKGIIQDIADDGISIHIHEAQNICQLINGMFFKVEFAMPSGEIIYLQCKVIRTHRQNDNTPEEIIGMKIIDQPPEYREFLKTLH